MKMLEDLEEVVRNDHEKCPNFWAAIEFIRTHHATIRDMAARLEAAQRDAETFRLCTSEHQMPNGERAECHLNVGVNVWRGKEWLSFHECSPSELRQVLDQAMQETGR